MQDELLIYWGRGSVKEFFCCVAEHARRCLSLKFGSAQYGPDESVQFVGGVVRSSRNVRQSNHVFANSIVGYKTKRRPGADEEWLAMTKHNRVEIESILIN